MTELEKILLERYDLRHVWLTIHEINEDPPFATDMMYALTSRIASRLHIEQELAVKVQAAYEAARGKHILEFYKAFRT